MAKALSVRRMKTAGLLLLLSILIGPLCNLPQSFPGYSFVFAEAAAVQGSGRVPGRWARKEGNIQVVVVNFKF